MGAERAHGSGLTFVQQAEDAYAGRRGWAVFTAVAGAGGFTGALTLSGESITSYANLETMWVVLEVTGIDTTTNDGVVQDALLSDDANRDSPESVVLGSSPGAGNVVLSYYMLETSGITPTNNLLTDLTLSGDVIDGSNVRTIAGAYDDDSPSDTATWSFSGTSGGAIYACELEVA